MPDKLSQENIEIIIKAYTEEDLSIKQIADKYGFGIRTIKKYLNINNVDTSDKHRHVTKNIDNIISLYNSGMSQDNIADILHVSRPTIRKILHKNNIHIRDNTENRDYYINENYFDNIDTQNKAYVLGFLYADGNVGKNKYRIQLSLQEGDKEILEKIKADMEYTAELSFRNFRQYNEKYNIQTQNQYCLSITCKHMWEALGNLGVIPNKTHVLKYPDFLQDEYHKHFIRGVLDGDGCIHKP